MIIFWIAVIIGIVFLIRWLVQSTRGGAGISGVGLGDPQAKICQGGDR